MNLIFEDDVERHLSQQGVKHPQIKIMENKRPPNVINRHPENDKRMYDSNTVPGNSSYSNITKHGKPLCIYSDSIVRCMHMANIYVR